MLPSDYFKTINCRLILGPGTTVNGLKLRDDLSLYSIEAKGRQLIQQTHLQALEYENTTLF